MPKAKAKRKYIKKNPTPKDMLFNLQIEHDTLRDSFSNLELDIADKNRKIKDLVNKIHYQYAEIAMLRERNLTLIEAIETLARASRLNKQDNQLNETVNQQCEAGYTHGYEKQL